PYAVTVPATAGRLSEERAGHRQDPRPARPPPTATVRRVAHLAGGVVRFAVVLRRRAFVAVATFHAAAAAGAAPGARAPAGARSPRPPLTATGRRVGRLAGGVVRFAVLLRAGAFFAVAFFSAAAAAEAGVATGVAAGAGFSSLTSTGLGSALVSAFGSTATAMS